MSNKPPQIKVPFVGHGSIPSGYLLGRVDPGTGMVQLISMAKAQSAGLIPSKLPPSGPAGGDLSGAYPNPVVAQIQGIPVKVATPTDGQVLTYVAADGKAEWKTPSGSGGSGASSFYLDGSDGYMAVVDPTTGQMVLDVNGNATYVKDPVLPASMIPATVSPNVMALINFRF